MRSWKRLVYYLLINVFVSACTTLLVLWVWDLRNSPTPIAQGGPALQTPAVTTAPVTPATSGALTPEAALDATPTLAGPPNPADFEAYQVEFGDTLGLIAEKYDVTIEAIMEANQITDPNALPVGMILYIPIQPGDAPPATPTVTPTPAAVVSGSAEPTNAAEDRVYITGIIGVGDINNEHVFLTRTGSGPLSLAGWRLQDEDGNVFSFPQLEFYTRGGVNVWTKAGASTPADLYWGLGEAIWRPGETVALYDADGELRASYTIP